MIVIAQIGIFASGFTGIDRSRSDTGLRKMHVYSIAHLSIFVLVFTKKRPNFFMKAISPAQLLAFSTSSSAATLPVTMERVTDHIGVEEEVASFVLPIGATINMDGTSLYQAVAAVFLHPAAAANVEREQPGQAAAAAAAAAARTIGTAKLKPPQGRLARCCVREKKKEQ